MILTTLGAKERRRLGRRSRPADLEPDPEPVTTTRATVVMTADEFADEAAAKEWLRNAGEEQLVLGVRALNGAMRAHRIAAADPTVREVSREQALVARVGYGTGDEVAYGQWSDALDIDPERRRSWRGGKATVLRPAERVAALLSAREEALVCEDLTLRARLDLDHGHLREAAVQLDAALSTALAELEDDDRQDLARRREVLATHAEGVAAAAATARRRELDEEQIAAITKALQRLEAALRARSMAGTAT